MAKITELFESWVVSNGSDDIVIWFCFGQDAITGQRPDSSATRTCGGENVPALIIVKPSMQVFLYTYARDVLCNSFRNAHRLPEANDNVYVCDFLLHKIAGRWFLPGPQWILETRTRYFLWIWNIYPFDKEEKKEIHIFIKRLVKTIDFLREVLPSFRRITSVTGTYVYRVVCPRHSHESRSSYTL